MINILGYGDPERWAVIFLICLSCFFLWTNKHAMYDTRTKVMLSIPRMYLVLYELIVILDAYNITRAFGDLVKTGIGGVYGLLLLFGAEAYVRWVNKKYGRC